MAKLVFLATLATLAFVVYMIAFRDPTEASVERTMTAQFGYQGAQCEEVATLDSESVFRCSLSRQRGVPGSRTTIRCYWVDADGYVNKGSFEPCQGL